MKRSSIEFLIPQIKTFSDNLIEECIEESYLSLDPSTPKEYEVMIIEQDGKLFSAVKTIIEDNGIIVHEAVIRIDFKTEKSSTIAQLVKMQQVLKEYFTPDGYIEPPKP